MIPKIVPIGTPNLKDVPASLRMLAEQIESGIVPEAEHIIVVAMTDGDMAVYGYGTVENRAHEIGCLQMAIIKMATE